MRYLTLFFTAILLMVDSRQSYAQQPVNISLFPGYHVINSDEVSSYGRVSETNWIYGGTVSTRTTFTGYPVEVSLGYSQGRSTIYSYISAHGVNYMPYKIDLRYQTLPIEALYIHRLNENVELMGGLNLAAQYRTLIFQKTFIQDNDRLLSFGIGLTGKIQTNLKEFDNGRGAIFGNLTARWTEFLVHNANGRNLDDYTLRHVALTPKIGLTLKLD